LQIYNFISSEDIVTITKDLWGWCSFGYEQLVQACVWSMSVHTSGCSFACRQRGHSSAKTQRLAQSTFNFTTFERQILYFFTPFYFWWEI